MITKPNPSGKAGGGQIVLFSIAAPAQAKPTVTTFNTAFGIVSVTSIPLPKAGECANVPIQMDVRNTAQIPQLGGMTIKLKSQFGNLVGYEEWGSIGPGEAAKPNGVYTVNLPVCGKDSVWTHSSGNRKQALQSVRLKETYELSFDTWLRGVPLGSSEYLFLPRKK